MSQQTMWTLVMGLAAAVPGLLAFWLLKRMGQQPAVERKENERLRAEAQAQRDETEKLRAEARALLHQVEIQAQIQDQLQEQIRAQQQTIRFLTKRVDELEAARAREYVETEALRQENEALRQELAELRRGVVELSLQMEAAKITPAWSPPAKPARVARSDGKGVDVVALRNRIADQFALEEISDLAFELHVSPDEISGTTAKTRARSLVGYLEDRDRLDELVVLCRSLRPDGGF